MAQDRDVGAAAGAVILDPDQPPDRRLNTHCLEVRAGHIYDAKPLSLLALGNLVHAGVMPAAEIRKKWETAAQLFEIGIRQQVVIPLGGREDHLIQTLRVAHRQGAEHQALEEREDRGVGADAEREGEHCYCDKARLLAHRSRRVREIPRDLVDPTRTVRLAAALAPTLGAAKLQPRLAKRMRARHSRAHQIVGTRFEMKADLVT